MLDAEAKAAKAAADFKARSEQLAKERLEAARKRVAELRKRVDDATLRLKGEAPESKGQARQKSDRSNTRSEGEDGKMGQAKRQKVKAKDARNLDSSHDETQIALPLGEAPDC